MCKSSYPLVELHVACGLRKLNSRQVDDAVDRSILQLGTETLKTKGRHSCEEELGSLTDGAGLLPVQHNT